MAANEPYVTRLAEGKIGGQERTFKVFSIDISDDLAAVAKVEAETPRAKFTHYFGLIKVEEAWQIVSVVTSLIFTATE